MEQKKRFTSITYLKFIAAFFIVNSHLEFIYPQKFSFLSFGGFFGNMLFFLISGYCLANIKQSFGPWIQKRFVRIYIPYLIILPFILNIRGFYSYIESRPLLYLFFPIEPYHFLPTILTAYPIFYTLSVLNKKTRYSYIYQIFTIIVAQIFFFYLWFDYDNESVYAHYRFMGVSSYIIMMLIGGVLRDKRSFSKSAIYLLLMVACFFLYALFTYKPLPHFLVILQIYISASFVLFLSLLFLSMEEKLKVNAYIDTLSNLTLEMYLCQFVIIGAYAKVAFPSNIILCILSIIGVAYAFNVLSNFILEKLIGNLKKK